IKGELPDEKERHRYAELLNKESLLHYDMQSFFRGYPFDAHPMSVLAAMSVSLSAFYPEMDDIDPELQVDFAVTRLVSKIRTITGNLVWFCSAWSCFFCNSHSGMDKRKAFS
nr:hypothetical protein [Bacteroidales bacterium]